MFRKRIYEWDAGAWRPVKRARKRLIFWRWGFGVLGIFAYVMGWLAIWNPGDLRLAFGYAFVAGAFWFLALDHPEYLFFPEEWTR